MANGIEDLIKKHFAKVEDGSFEGMMCAFALEMLRWKRNQWMRNLFIASVVLVPIVIVVLDKVL